MKTGKGSEVQDSRVRTRRGGANQYTNREVRLPYQYTNRAAQHEQYTNREQRLHYQYTDSGGGVVE